MKAPVVAILTCLIVSASPLLLAEARADDPPERRSSDDEAARALARSADRGARLAGVAEVGSIACDHFFIHCTCSGTFHCAWLAWACSVAGGVQGFEGDCFLPSSVPGADDALDQFTSRAERDPEEARCEGIFCSCTGPADSEDCNKITGCIDEIHCIGDSCGCIGGRVED